MNILCQIQGGRKKTRDYCSSWEYVKRVIKYVDNILSEGIAKLNTPTPLGYELNNELKPIRHYYLSLDGMIPEGGNT